MVDPTLIGDIFVGSVPIASGFLTSWAVSGVGSDAGSAVAARPPPAAFGVAWSLLYAMIGASWIASVRVDRSDRLASDVMYASLSAMLCAWIVVYSRQTKEARRYAVWVLVACLAVANSVWAVASHRSPVAGGLLGPLIAWLVFATLMNFTEVQIEQDEYKNQQPSSA